jgi:hypothetical protein
MCFNYGEGVRLRKVFTLEEEVGTFPSAYFLIEQRKANQGGMEDESIPLYERKLPSP